MFTLARCYFWQSRVKSSFFAICPPQMGPHGPHTPSCKSNSSFSTEDTICLPGISRKRMILPLFARNNTWQNQDFPESWKLPNFQYLDFVFNAPRSGGRWWALLWRSLYNKVLGRGFMGSKMDSDTPLARSRSDSGSLFGRNNTPKKNSWRRWGPHGAPGANPSLRLLNPSEY